MNKIDIMIIDNNEIDIFINQRVFEFSKCICEIDLFQSPSMALEKLQNKSVDQMPQLILLDLNMPVMDGFEFLLHYSKLDKEKKSKIRLVVLSNSDSARDKEKINANEDVSMFVSKPLTSNDIDSILRKVS